jgi:hypothetical protein
MNISPYISNSTPDNMVADVFNSAPTFTLTTKKFGFEVPFYRTGLGIVNAATRYNKGISLLSNTDSSIYERGYTMYDSEAVTNFTSNAFALAYGASTASSFKYIFGDYEGVYGDVNNSTTRERVANFAKGVKDAGSYFGQWVDAMSYFTSIQVWDAGATTFYNTPIVSGIGNQSVTSLGGTLNDQINMNIVIGYGVDLSRNNAAFDPEVNLYNYIHRFRAIKKMKEAGLISHVQKQIGFLAGYCDNFGANVPIFRHRVYLDAPYTNTSYIYQDYLSEESLATMESYALYGMLEGDGIWYWKSPGIAISDAKNDSVDILYSGFDLNKTGFSGSPSPPTPFGVGHGNRPTPNRSYNYIDGLSVEEVFKSAHVFSQIENIVSGGTKIDADFSYKRGAGSWVSVSKPSNGSGIVADYQGGRPIVTKIINGNNILFICTDPKADNLSTTKIKVSHSGNQWIFSMQDRRTKVFKTVINSAA